MGTAHRPCSVATFCLFCLLFVSNVRHVEWLGEVALFQWIPVRAEMVYVNDKLGARLINSQHWLFTPQGAEMV